MGEIIFIGCNSSSFLNPSKDLILSCAQNKLTDQGRLRLIVSKVKKSELLMKNALVFFSICEFYKQKTYCLLFERVGTLFKREYTWD